MEIINGNIIDIAYAVGEWFIIFDDGRTPMEGFKTKQEAKDTLEEIMKGEQNEEF